MMNSSDQPCRKPTSGWNASRKNAYWPPARGTTVASSANTNAPHSAITPPSTHTARLRNGVSTFCATRYGLMKIPDPMMPLTTIIVASSGPSLRASGMPRRYVGPAVSRHRAAPAGAAGERPGERLEAVEVVDRAVLVDVGQQRADAGGAGLEAGVAQERVEPDQPPARPPQPRGLGGEGGGVLAIEAVGDQQHDGALRQDAPRPGAVEL